MRWSRILFLSVAALLALAVTGCSGDEGARGSSPAAPKSAAFPARVEHQFGTTTVPVEPQRIVVVGVTEQDTVLALGYKPIATTEWYGKHRRRRCGRGRETSSAMRSRRCST